MGLGSWLWCGPGLAAALGIATAAFAVEPLPSPAGEVILTVTGDIGVQNSGDTAVFDLAMMEGLGAVEITTGTIWTEGEQVFVGVPLATLLTRLGAEGTVVAASALNDYTIEIPMADAVEDGPILAYRQNGQALSVRDKGPLWLIYPYDDNPDYQTEVIYARSIWQLARMEVR